MRTIKLATLTCILLWGIAPELARSAPDRFTAVFSSGARSSGDEVLPWHASAAEPRLSGKALFDPADPVRWLKDDSLPAGASPQAFVELVGGDVLPGRVMAYTPGGDLRGLKLLPHLLVEPAVPVDFPQGKRLSAVRVLTRWVRRIVWEKRGGDRRGSNILFFRDGRQLEFRSFRWREGSVVLLLEGKTAEVPFGQIAELHLAPGDPWQAYFDELVFLGSDGAPCLVEIETTDGLRMTSSRERFRARHHGQEGDPKSWFHSLQPAWSLDPIWIAHRSIRVRRFFSPAAPPLSRLEPQEIRRGAILSSSWGVQLDRNVQGGPLKSGGQNHGWGLGVHAPTELRFPLPACARAFRTRIGLDQVVGEGGCARARIGGRGLSFESPVLVGSGQVADSGWLDLNKIAAGGGESLVLIADPVLEGAPAGADPLDVRDVLNWIEPELALDPDDLRMEVLRRMERWMPAWEDWTLEGADLVPLALTNRWHAADSAWEIEASPLLPFLKLRRKLSLGSDPGWLVVACSKHPGLDMQSRLRVSVDSKILAERDVPDRGWEDAEPDPMAFSLKGFQGRDVLVELVQLPSGPQSLVEWRQLAVLETPPGLARLLEDDLDLPEGAAGGTASLVKDEKWSGDASVRIVPAATASPIVLGLEMPIRENPRIGEFRFLRFAWKKKGGERICLQLTHDGRFGAAADAEKRSFRYDAGKGEPAPGGALRVAGEAPREWAVVIRDLHADFGSFDLTGIACSALDGEYALLDQVYLGRRRADLEALDKETDRGAKR